VDAKACERGEEMTQWGQDFQSLPDAHTLVIDWTALAAAVATVLAVTAAVLPILVVCVCGGRV
jgi:hypothetical protein